MWIRGNVCMKGIELQKDFLSLWYYGRMWELSCIIDNKYDESKLYLVEWSVQLTTASCSWSKVVIGAPPSSSISSVLVLKVKAWCVGPVQWSSTPHPLGVLFSVRKWSVEAVEIMRNCSTQCGTTIRWNWRIPWIDYKAVWTFWNHAKPLLYPWAQFIQ